MKKLLTFTATGALVLSLALMGCGSSTTEEDSRTEKPEEPIEEPLVGGWETNAEANATLSAKELDVFTAATEGLTGVAYTPVALLGTQVVAGTNYAFLCSGVASNAAATQGWYVLVVYENLEGAVELTSAEQIDVNNVQVLDEAENEELVGGWEQPEREAAALLPTEAQTAFEQAIEKYTGVDLSPIACLGTQLVSGTNYRILCAGTMVTPGAQPALYVVDVYADLDGNAEIIDVQVFDMLSYLAS